MAPSPPPPYATNDPSEDSPEPATTEATELSPWQRRWNTEWLNEAFIPHMRRNDLLMERPTRRDKNHYSRKESRQSTNDFILAAASEGLVSPKKAVTKTRALRGTRHITWPARKLASDIKTIWGRWRKHRGDTKHYKVVAVMEDRADDPQWRGKMELTFRDKRSLLDFLNTDNRGKWINMPSHEDIKWYSVLTPSRVLYLQTGPAAFGPEPYIPFVPVDGHIVRDCRPGNAHTRSDGNIFNHFARPDQIYGVDIL